MTAYTAARRDPKDAGPATQHMVVTPSDVHTYTGWRAIYIGGAGNLALVVGGVSVTYAVVAGGRLEIGPDQVLSTDTTATGLVLWA